MKGDIFFFIKYMSSLSHEMFFGETLCVLYVHNLEAMQIYPFSAYMEKLWLNIYGAIKHIYVDNNMLFR